MHTHKKRTLFQFLIWLIIIVLINYINTFAFKRFDLTSEKRFTLSDVTVNMIKNLQDIVFTRIYLEGDLPIEFKHLRDATKEILDEFRAYNHNIQYEFVNPSENPDEKTRVEIYKDLIKRGVKYRNVEQQGVDEKSEKIIFTGAIMTYNGQEIPFDLLQDRLGETPDAIINNSIQQLEYKLASTIMKLTRPKRQKIAFLQGQGELSDAEVGDISKTLSEFYTVHGVTINGRLNALKDYDALIIAKPDSAFDEKDKFIIDQFIMHGGKTLWLLDKVSVSMDSLMKSSTTLAMPNELRLDDQLFKYGIRINNKLVMDLMSAKIPVVTGYLGKQRYFPWYFFPLLVPDSKHAVVHNVNTIKAEFINNIDTLHVAGSKKTILLHTSPYTRLLKMPCRVSLNILQQPPDENMYRSGRQIAAVLLEGEFNSVFDQRIPPNIATDKAIDFRSKSKATKMIVIADGDMIRNYVSKDGNRILPLGYDRYTNITYGNKDFLMNAVNYLCDDSGLIEVRSKEFKIRLLDKQKIINQRTKWQILNTVCPVILIILSGYIKALIRKRKFR